MRFFGGADLGAASTNPRELVEQGYRNGVPMGGTIEKAAKAPTFTVWASKDPDGANLDRIQIIKGMVDANGEPQDKVIDVVWSGDRKPGKDGKMPPVGNTVDATTGDLRQQRSAAPELMGTWTDPDFDPNTRTRSTTSACSRSRRRAGPPTTRCATSCALLTTCRRPIQERAWTSPIWYSPSGT